jgi:anti-sigma B factor antagonist
LESDREDDAIGAADEMSDATERVRRRAWLLTQGASVPPQPRAAGLRRADTSGDVVRGVDGRATFATTTHVGYAVLTVTGQLDLETAPSLRRHLVNLVAQRHALIVLDLTDVDFMDSGGLSAVVGGLKRARQAGASIRVVATRRELTQLFQVTGVYKVLPLYDSVQAATERT